MLAQLIILIEMRDDGLSLAEISRALDAQPSAVLAMIEILVRKGKLIEFGLDGQCCSDCGQISGCNLLATQGKRYAAASRVTNSG